MNIRRFALVLTALCVMLAANAQALDGKRQGFVIGAGLGWGSATQTLEASGGGLDVSASTTTSGLATDFRIGGGLNDRWLLYYTNQVVFFQNPVNNVDKTFAQGLNGVGATYFFGDQAPSFLLEAALGAGVLTNFDDDESDGGFGILLGFGYEFARHFEIKADWNYAQLGKEAVFDTEVKASIGTFRITLNWLGY